MIPRRRILSDALKLFDLAIMVLAFALATVPALGVGRTISMAESRASINSFGMLKRAKPKTAPQLAFRASVPMAKQAIQEISRSRSPIC